MISVKQHCRAVAGMAVVYYNRINRRSLIPKRLTRESKIVKRESLAVLAEFETLQDEN